MKGKDNMFVANKCAELIDKYKPDAVCVDAGNGTGIIDRLREMNYRVNEVWFGSKSADEAYANKRTEIWALMRDWLSGGCLPSRGQAGYEEIRDDLAGPEYHYQKNGDKIALESKDAMKSRGLSSPDFADALACTFAVKVARKDNKLNRKSSKGVRLAESADSSIY